MDDDIKAIIAKNLPAQVGDVLKARLTQAENDAKSLTIYKNDLERARAETKELAEYIKTLEFKVKLAGELQVREAAISKREQALELTLAVARAENAEKSTSNLMGLVSSVFRNTVVRENIHRTDSKQVTNPGGYTTQMPESSTSSHTREVE